MFGDEEVESLGVYQKAQNIAVLFHIWHIVPKMAYYSKTAIENPPWTLFCDRNRRCSETVYKVESRRKT
jgi:hypothetical protein